MNDRSSFRLASALVFVTPPTASSVIALTAANTGTAANAYTLVASPNVSGKLAVSGATLSGGVAPDLYNIVVASSTSSGGTYTNLVTWSNVGGTRAAYRTEVATNITVNEWLKLTITLASGAGTSQTFAANVCFGRYWQA